MSFRGPCERHEADRHQAAGVGLAVPFLHQHQGLDKNPAFVKRMTERGDKRVLDKVRDRAVSGREKPTKEQIKAYFEQNKASFKSADTVRMDQIWCENLASANKARAELDGGADLSR